MERDTWEEGEGKIDGVERKWREDKKRDGRSWGAGEG